jgi:hypothetical protein
MDVFVGFDFSDAVGLGAYLCVVVSGWMSALKSGDSK